MLRNFVRSTKFLVQARNLLSSTKQFRFLRLKDTRATDLNISPRQYYEELLNREYVDEDGCLQIDPTH